MEQALEHREDSGHEQKHVVHIKVNDQNVVMPTHEANGLQIKEAAIAQGVQIQLNFLLELDEGHKKSRVIDNNETVHLHDGMSFTAIRNDDNS